MPTLSANSTVLDSVMNALRVPVSNVTERAKIQGFVSDVYGDICSKSDWWWLQRHIVRNTTPKITAGTISVTENSAAVTFSTAPQQFSANVSVVDFVLCIASNAVDSQAAYRIATHTAGDTAATLDATYTGGTDAAAAYRLYEVSYNLPQGCAKLLQVKRFGMREPIRRIGIEDLNYLQMTTQQEGKPQVYSIFDFVTGAPIQRRLLQIWPYPDQAYRMELWYKYAQTGDTSVDLDLPVDYQQALVYGALARCYPIFLNDLERGAYYQALFNDVMALMTAQQREYASDHPGVQPVMGMYRRASSRRRVGYTSLGSYFDTLPNIP